MTRHSFAVAAVAICCAAPAFAAPVNLSSFAPSGFGTWTIAPGGGIATQTTNGADLEPAFLSGGGNVQGQSLTATVRVDPATPQQLDRIGFALGLGAGENFDPLVPVDFWLIDWQGADKTFFSSPISAGLALSHVTGRATDQLWTHNRLSDGTFDPSANNVVEEVARGTTLGSTGWLPNVTYDVRIDFTATLIEVFVDDLLEISHAGNFTDGRFGFYTQGQPGVTFTLASDALGPIDPIDPSVVPLPAGFSLLLAGLGALGLLRRRSA